MKILDTLWAIVQAELQDNPNWMDKADKKILQAWKAFTGKVNTFDLSGSDEIDTLTKFLDLGGSTKEYTRASLDLMSYGEYKLCHHIYTFALLLTFLFYS